MKARDIIQAFVEIAELDASKETIDAYTRAIVRSAKLWLRANPPISQEELDDANASDYGAAPAGLVKTSLLIKKCMQIDLSPLKRLALTEMEKCLTKLVLELLPEVSDKMSQETREELTGIMKRLNGGKQ